MIDTKMVVKVGIADLNIVRIPDTIRTSGLGSCVGAVLYDETAKIAGMVHVMLPDSQLAKGDIAINKAKFADTGVQELMRILVEAGASKYRIKAKIAGGAQMFQFSSKSELMRIGPRNVEAVKKELKLLHIRLVAEDTGGNSGRTIEFDPETSILQVRTVNKGTSEI